MRPNRALPAILAAVALGACGSSRPEEKESERVCSPNLVERCACPSGREGERGCSADGNAWGACICPPPICPEGTHDDGTGNCVPEGACAAGLHPDITGLCCPEQFHNGGTGTCVEEGSCAAERVVDETGLCCPHVMHNGGAGDCVAGGECSQSFELDGNRCVVP